MGLFGGPVEPTGVAGQGREIADKMQAMQLAAGRAGGAVPSRRGAAAILAGLCRCGTAGRLRSRRACGVRSDSAAAASGSAEVVRFPGQPAPAASARCAVRQRTAGVPQRCGQAALSSAVRSIRRPALPASPARAAGYPLISAGEAFRALVAAAAQGPAAGIGLKAEHRAAGPGGLHDRPWHAAAARLAVCGFRGIQGLAAVLAVAPAGIFSPPRPALRSPLVSTARLGSNRRTPDRGVRRRRPRALAHVPLITGWSWQNPGTAVVVGVLKHDHAGGMSCAAGGYPRRATAVLLVPLGSRVVVDAVQRHRRCGNQRRLLRG